jgi:nucleotidyltransferase/DNA polymerase involved in DNA repair
VTVIQRGTEGRALSDLPLACCPSPKFWKRSNVGVSARSAHSPNFRRRISERLGQEGVKLHKLAQGAGARPIVPHVEALAFRRSDGTRLRHHTIEPLTFILSRMLDQICSRCESAICDA